MRLKIPANAAVAAKIGDWTLYELRGREDDSPLWLRFKLMRAPHLPRKWGVKRAYYLLWNPLELRYRKDKEGALLARNDPDLYERVELLLSLDYGPEWLVRVGGMTLEEIEAEKARLAAYASERRHRTAVAAGIRADLEEITGLPVVPVEDDEEGGDAAKV